MIKEQARQILNHYGLQHQKAKTIEELGELIVALQKDLLSGKDGLSQDVLEEIADVHIMIAQLLDDEGDKTTVSLIVDKKLKRQMRRIKAEKENNKTCKSCKWYITLSPLVCTCKCYCSKSDECGNYIDGSRMTCQEWER